MGKPTTLIRVNRSNPNIELDWTLGYEGLKFNCYHMGPHWVYEDQVGLWLLENEQVTECGKAHVVNFSPGYGTLVCELCEERIFIKSHSPRAQQKLIRDFILRHGAPNNWEFQQYVLRDERRYHYSDYSQMTEPDASHTGLLITATKLSDGSVVVTDNEGGVYTKS